jgi:hypothetical protein
MRHKDRTIRELLKKLDLRSRGWAVVDHWEADLCAIGIAKSSDPLRLIYVSTFGKAPGHYYYDCDVLSADDPGDDRTVASESDVEFDVVLKAAEQHLG